MNAYKLPFSKSEAETSNIDYSMIKEIVSNVSPASDVVVDYDKDGCVDNVTIILVGGASYPGGTGMPTLYPHQNSYPGNDSWDGKLIRNYNVLNTNRMLETMPADESGVICHEFYIHWDIRTYMYRIPVLTRFITGILWGFLPNM